MQIVIRADASIEMGSGHLMRCLTLADSLHRNGATVAFICRELPGNLCDFVEKKGFPVYRLPYDGQELFTGSSQTPHAHWLKVSWQVDAQQVKSILLKRQKPDWLIIDHYGLDREWENQLRPYVQQLMVIDDLADRPHDCDALLDQNLYENMNARYQNHVPANCQKLLGPQYALLRREFAEARKNLKEWEGKIRRILVFFGGSDPDNVTAKVLEALFSVEHPNLAIDVVVGAINQHKDQIRSLCAAREQVNYYCQVENMAQLMANADLAIGAGGTATWERCCLGLPALVVEIADNQVESVICLQKVGAIFRCGNLKENFPPRVLESLNYLMNNQPAVIKASKICANLVDGYGCERTISRLMNST